MKQNFNEIKQNWNFYMCTVDEKAASIRLNFALSEIAPIENYTHRLTIFMNYARTLATLALVGC